MLRAAFQDRARCSLLLAVTAAASPARAQALRRFAIVAGNDVGGGDTRSLLYASADARKVHDILTRLGGVRAEDATLLIGASASQLLSAIVSVETQRRRGRAARRADGAVLLLLGPRQGRRAAAGRDAHPDRRHQGAHRRRRRSTCAIAILDSCRSGALTRTRGRASAPAFEIQSEQPARRQGARHPDVQHVRRGLAGVGRDRRQLLLAPPGERPAGRRRPLGRRARDAVRGVRLRVRPHRRRHRRERRRRAAPDVQLRPGRQRRPGADRRRGAPRGRLLSTRGARAGSISSWTARASSPRRSARPTASTAASRCRPAATASSAGCPTACASARSTCRAGSMVALAEAQLRDAPFSDDPVKGAGRVDLTSRWSLGAGATYQSVFAAPSGASLFPPTGMLAVDLSLRNFLRRDWVLEPRRRGRLDRRRRHQRRRAVPVQRGVAGVVAAGRVAGPLRDAVRRRPPGACCSWGAASPTISTRRSSSRRCRPASSAAPPSAS